MLKKLTFLLLSLMLSFAVHAQDKPYTEIKLYTNLYSQTENFDENADKIKDVSRRSFVTNIIELNFQNPNKQIWWGIDGWFRASLLHDEDDSPFQALKYQSNGNTAQTAFSHIGPKLIWKPSKKDPNLSTKFLALIPLGGGTTNIGSNIPALDNSGFQLWSQINYNKKLADGLYGYGEFSVVARLGRNNLPENDVFIPIKGFLSFFPSQGVGIFGFFDYTPTITNPTAYYFQPGGGVKFFPSKKWEIELSASKFVAGQNAGAGFSANLGLTYRIKSKAENEK